MEQRAEKIFNGIAPFYGLFFNFQLGYYQKILSRVKPHFDLFQYQSIIDVGCGTGALCWVLSSQGMRVTGVDQAEKMLAIADKRLKNTGVELVLANALKPIPFADKSFDVAISTYTVHGMMKEEREKMYQEMKRLAEHRVIFHDYNDKRSLLTDIAERLEGGDYFNFIKNPKGEMGEYFREVQVVTVDKKAAWYICTP